MAILGDAHVRIRPDMSRFGAETNGQMGKLGKAAGVAFAGAFAAAGVGGMFKSAIDGASDLNETINKSNTIFKNNAKEVVKWSKGSAKAYGLSQSAALEYNASLGNMLNQLGFTEKESLKASKSTIALAADLGSFNNLETGDVLDKINGAIRGEYDSLQALIPNINAARVENEAMAATGKTAAKELTAQEKATATLAIIQKDGAAAAGDFAKTSDGLANSQKILKARFEDAKSSIGQAFLPAVTGAVSYLSNTALPGILDFGGRVKETFANIGNSDAVSGIRTFATNLQNDITTNPAWDIGKTILSRLGSGIMSGDFGPLSDSIKTAFTMLDTKKVGEGLGSAIRGGLANIGDIATSLGGVIKGVIQKVNWPEVALEIGKIAPTVALGFITGLLNFDFGAAFKFVADNWVEVGLAVLSIAFAPARLIAGIAKILAKIPFAGSLLSWGLLAFKKLADGGVTALFGVAKRFGAGLAAGSPVVIGGLVRITTGLMTKLRGFGGEAVSFVGTIPGKIAGAIGKGAEFVGKAFGSLIDKMRTPLVGLLRWINTNFLSKLNNITKMFGLTIPLIGIPAAAVAARKPNGKGGVQAFASGGIIPGYTPGRDTGLYALGGGEAILRPEVTRAVGPDWVNSVNQAARLGQLKGRFADGGIVGAAKGLGQKAKSAGDWAKEGIASLASKGAEFALKSIIDPAARTVGGWAPPFLGQFGSGVLKKLSSSAGKWGKAQEAMGLAGGGFGKSGGSPNGNRGLGPMAAAARAFVMKTFGIKNIGGYANRNIAGTGKKSDHALGKAIDVMIPGYKTPAGKALGNKVASYFVNNPKAFGTKYVIWNDQINTGKGWKRYGHPSGKGGDTLQHRDHVHTSVYDRGGLIQPGNTMVQNKSGKPEAVLTNEEMKQYKELIANGGNAPVVGNLTVVSTGKTKDDTEEVMFQLRSKKRGVR